MQKMKHKHAIHRLLVVVIVTGKLGLVGCPVEHHPKLGSTTDRESESACTSAVYIEGILSKGLKNKSTYYPLSFILYSKFLHICYTLYVILYP